MRFNKNLHQNQIQKKIYKEKMSNFKQKKKNLNMSIASLEY